MKTLFVVFLFGCSLLLQDSRVSPAQKKDPQTISTEPKDVIAELRVGDKKLADVRGEAVFTPKEGNPDDTLMGTLIIKFSEVERARIALLMGKQSRDISTTVERDDVVTVFEKDASCPDLRFEFFKRYKDFDFTRAEFEFSGARLRFPPFVLRFKESGQELSRVLCVWARGIKSGRGTRMHRRFNELLNGEDSNK